MDNSRWRAICCRVIRQAVRPAVVRPYVNIYFTWRDFFSVTGGISVKLGTNIHHEWACWKDFLGHGVKGQDHAATPVEISWTCQLVNAEGIGTKSPANTYYSRETYRLGFQGHGQWSRSYVDSVQVCECYNGGDIHFDAVAFFHMDCNNRQRRSQGVQWVQVHPRARKKWGRAGFMGVSYKCSLWGQDCTPLSGGRSRRLI